MTVNVDSKKMDAALRMVQGSRYFDALTVFMSIDSYEAKVNAIACLCALGEDVVAENALSRLYARYGDEYNCVVDVSSFGECTERIAKSFFSKLDEKILLDADNKLSADKNLLGEYDRLPDDMDELGLELDFFSDSQLWEDPAYNANNFFDTNSAAYHTFLRLQVEKNYLEGDEEGVMNYGKRLMSLETDDLQTIEAQLAVAYLLQKKTKSVQFAKRIVDFGDKVSFRALRVAAAALMDSEQPRYKKNVAQLFALSEDVITKFSPLDLNDMIVYSTNVLKDYQQARRFALRLFEIVEESCCCLDNLKVCACAFCNADDSENARKAAIKILQACPFDAFASSMLQYVNSRFGDGVTVKMNFCSFDRRCYWLPFPLEALQTMPLLVEDESYKPPISQQIVCLNALVSQIKACFMEQDETRLLELCNLVSYTLDHMEVSCQQFMREFAFETLCQPDMPVYVTEMVLRKAVKLGYRGKVFLAAERYCFLDLSKLTLDDQVFQMAVCLCGAFFVIDVTQLQQIYLQLLCKLGGNLPKDVSVMQVVYYLLKRYKPDFESTEFAQAFDESERNALDSYFE